MSGLTRAADLARARTRTHQGKVERALEHLQRVADQAYVVSWSGGKDSTVCVALAAEAWPDGVVIVSDTQAASGEIARLAHEWAERAPHLDFIIRPTRRPDLEDRRALRSLLDRLSVRGVVLGLRAEESGYRRRIARTLIDPQTRTYTTADHWGRIPALCPILDWTADDIWAYITTHGLPYHEVYDREGRGARSPHEPWRTWD